MQPALPRMTRCMKTKTMSKQPHKDCKAADIVFTAHVLSSIKSSGVLEMKGFCHHGRVSTYKHCMRVALCAKRLNSTFHLKASENELVRAGILHDYFGYDWHNTTNKKHATNHPVIACKRACKEFALTEKEQNCILSHMWPLPPTRIPRCREAWIICIADKICALEETLFMR